MRFSLLLLPLALAGCAMGAATPPKPALYTETVSQRMKAPDTLYVVVNGDGVRSPVDTGSFARALAAAEPRAAVVRLLRPGYADNAGNQSPGMRGTGGGDDYTPDRIAAVGDTIAALRARYRRARVVAVGEGGGAVMIANLAGLRPNLLDGIVLVSCPCSLPEWRRHMARRDPAAPRWKVKVDSLDPLQTAGGISPTLRAAILIGGKDEAVPARFARVYAEALSLRGIATDFRILPGRSSPVLDDPQVIEAARRLAAALPRKAR